jgi:hypothetical protein
MHTAYYSNMLRALCDDNREKVAPYVSRTRFERGLYGLLAAFSQDVSGAAPLGINKAHMEGFIHGRDLSPEVRAILMAGSKIFERFSYLCDTSNWSNDGQDPRIELCRADVLLLCEAIAHPGSTPRVPSSEEALR